MAEGGAELLFWVVGKKVVVQPPETRSHGSGLSPTSRLWWPPASGELCTKTDVSCPPRSLTGLGSEIMKKEFSYSVMEFKTTSSGGLLRALSGAIVWRTPGDLARLLASVRHSYFADGRLVWDVYPHLVLPEGEPLSKLVRANGRVGTFTRNMRRDIREYIDMLVADAEENRLPLALLRRVISFLGCPPGDIPDQQSPSSATDAGGRAKQSLGTEREMAAAFAARARSERGQSRRRAVPTDPENAQLEDLVELSPLPRPLDRRVDQQLADDTVRVYSRPEAAVWEGSWFSERWRRELATQLWCRNVARMTYASRSRALISRPLRERCYKQDFRRMSWAKIQEQKKQLEISRQARDPPDPKPKPDAEQKEKEKDKKERNGKGKKGKEKEKQEKENNNEEALECPPHRQGSRALDALGKMEDTVKYRNRMLVKPPELKNAPAILSKPMHKFGPRERRPTIHQGASPSAKKLQGQTPGRVKSGTSYPPQSATGEPETPDAQQRFTMKDYRDALVDKNAKVILKGRPPAPRERRLPPPSPLAGPSPSVPPPPRDPAPTRWWTIKPGLGARLADSLLSPSPPPPEPAQVDEPPSQSQQLQPLSLQVSHPSGDDLSAPSISWWGNLVRLVRQRWRRLTVRPPVVPWNEPVEEEAEEALEATESCIRAILRYQSTLPPQVRGQLHESSCLAAC